MGNNLSESIISVLFCFKGFCSSFSLDGCTGKVLWLIVDASYRGKSLGKYLLVESMARLRNHNIVLNAVDGTERFYENVGFQKTGVSNYKYTWKSATPSNYLGNGPVQVKPLKDVNIEKLLAYDQGIHPITRDHVAKLLLAPQQPNQTLFQIALSEDGTVLGLIRVRKTHCGHTVGPFYADNPLVARVLLDNVHGSLGDGAQLLCYSPSTNVYFRQVLVDLGINPPEPSKESQMQTKGGLVMDWTKVYASYANAPTLL